MARTDVTLDNIAGFLEEVKILGTEQTVDLRKTYAPLQEEFHRQNQWAKKITAAFSEQEVVITKVNTDSIVAQDFVPTQRKAGQTTVPEKVRILMDETKEWAAEYYAKDWELSNGTEQVGAILTAAVFRKPDNYFDAKIATFMAAEAAANTLVPQVEMDIDGMAITAENGELVYNAILELLLAFIESGEDNEYVEGTKFPREQIEIAISIRASELLVASKRVFIDQSGLANAGGFGTQFRNVTIDVMDEMADGQHVLVFSKRSVASNYWVRHTKYVGEDNPNTYMTSVNQVVDMGAGLVYENEVTGILQTTVVVPSSVKKAEKAVAKTEAIAEEAVAH